MSSNQKHSTINETNSTSIAPLHNKKLPGCPKIMCTGAKNGE